MYQKCLYYLIKISYFLVLFESFQRSDYKLCRTLDKGEMITMLLMFMPLPVDCDYCKFR